ncbi:X-Pro dipeptidyl-peptidase [Nonlabens dokdonensis]|uniref:X-Pro dipeptidyl-peptidase n=1 Tax=Nonlabens dokdonensis TaxID=328515 RepID=A0A1Z8B2Q2_9FLAO|nr:CocE/NonD family hydrolase [Nonlabens dokdonensis]OUS16853.1 X-Pro dipeptidyl-peptidase [Nonlabens dokdonensis]
MKNYILLILFVFGSAFAKAQSTTNYVKENYTKTVHKIEMRDGIKLYTVVYAPKDTSRDYPIMLQRTCYSVRPYGENEYKRSLGPNKFMMEEGYIFVYQDVRGRWMSEGDFDNMRPHIAGNDVNNKKDIDESSDTYDTIEWLINNLPNNNKKVGQWGISYPGFYTAAALPEAHPALVASSPQAPIGDFFFDDFHHMGATLQSYLMAYPVFGHQTEPTTESWYNDKWDKMRAAGNMKDSYEFNMGIGPLKNVTENIFPDNFFWKDVATHPNYDEFWQKRAIINHLQDVDHAVMTVGGWFDAEDLYGPLNIYKNVERFNPDNKNNTIVMGPWSHGNWSRERGKQMVNHIHFGDSISTFYQKNIETPFFEHHLKGKKNPELPEAYMFDTGTKEWNQFTQWPPKDDQIVFGFGKNGELLINKAGDKNVQHSYISDPMKPVPFRSEVTPVTFTPRAYMTDDQRHASRRPDVLTFQTDILDSDMRLAGEIQANLEVILKDITDADFIVKVIDVYPSDMKNGEHTPEHVTLAGYQQLVRAETFRGRFRNDFSKPEPFKEGKRTQVNFPLQDVLHTFKKGHRIMIQIHSTWFPYIDRNPQKYVDNIFEAKESDFTAGQVTILGSSTVTIGENNGIEMQLPKLKQ